MRILAANKFYYVFGGSDRYFFELNDLHQKAGHEVIPFAMTHPQNYPSPYASYFVSQVNYWEQPTWSDKVKAAGRMLYSTEARRQIRALVEDTRPGIAHVHLIYHQISPAILPILKSYGLPIVQTLHDYKPVCPTYSFVANGTICERCQGKHFFQATLQRCNHHSFPASLLNSVEMYLHHFLEWYDLPDVYITPSRFMREKLIAYGMPAEKLQHIANFVDPEKYPFGEQSEDYFVYVGRLAAIKGVHTLLKAMTQVRQKQVRLLIIGDGPQRDELEKLKEDLKLDRVEFVGYQTAVSLRTLVGRALFTVLPSECYENCPMAVLEAMSMGKATVGARIGGIPELIEHGEDGLLFTAGDVDDLATTLNAMLADKTGCRQMGEKAHRKAIEQYNPQEHYRQVTAVYQQLL